MPITIDIKWTVEAGRDDAQEIVRSLHQAAQSLPFTGVSEIVDEEWGDTQTRDPERRLKRRKEPMSDEELERHFLRWPGRWFVRNDFDNDADGELIEPRWSRYFTAELNGGGPFHVGLAEHVEQINVKREPGTIMRASTGLDGRLAWQCRVETMNAALPQRGGWDNFLKQHTAVLALVKEAQQLGLDLAIWDQGGYWETGNEAALREELERSMSISAHSFGAMKDLLDGDRDLSEIMELLKHPNFEQFEMRGEQISQEDTVGRRVMEETEKEMREEPWKEHHRRMLEEDGDE